MGNFAICKFNWEGDDQCPRTQSQFIFSSHASKANASILSAKMASNVNKLTAIIAVAAHCFGALSRV